MSRSNVRGFSLCGTLFLLLIRTSGGDPVSLQRPRAAVGSRPLVGRSLASLPLAFVENCGQLDSRVSYYVPGREASVYFTRDAVTFVLRSGGEGVAARKTERASLRPDGAESAARRHVVRLEFRGANPEARLRAGDRAAGHFNYFRGPRETWQAGIPTYHGVVYEELWPGIDLVYGGTASRLKYELVVRPGADPRRIHLAYRGAGSVRRTEDGDLEVETSAGRFRDQKPVAYQAAGGGRQSVNAAFRPVKSRSAETFAFGFDVGEYDRSRPLVIDPAVLISSGFVGGSGNESGVARVALDLGSDIYIAGSTDSTESSFPVAVGPDNTYNGGSFDGFVARVKADGSGLVYAGYIGGSGNDTIDDIALDFSGNAYVVGRTDSTQASFPVLGGPDLTYNGGVFDAFVAKVNPAGTALVYCGYIGGSLDDRGTGIAVDFAGNGYVTGFTSSNNLPVAVGPDLTYNGGFDGFVAKVAASGANLTYCGYIGGSLSEQAYGIAWHFSGTVTIVGETSSTETTSPNAFPVAVGPDLTYNGGLRDGFIAQVNATGSALNYCGYIGGSGTDDALAVAVDSSNEAYVTGKTSSAAGFPVLVGPDLTYNGGTIDAFVARVNAGGATLAYCGYIGGAGDDIGDDIAVDDVGGAVVVGSTSSTETTFPVLVGPDLTYNGGSNAFVAKVAPGGRRLDHCGYIGAASAASGVALDSNGDIVVSGLTGSDETAFPVLVGPDLTANGGADAFVTRMTGCNGLLVNTTGDTVDVAPGDGACADASGNCSLRAAIQEANAAGFQVRTICVPSGTYSLTINDAAGDENAAATGDLDITTGYDILGDGLPGSVIIDAGGTAGSPRRVFDIQPGVNDPGVGMFNLIIQGGYAAARGGGIRVQTGSDLQMALVILRNNQASLSGGGLALEGSASATILASTIANNQVLTAGEFGGGLWIDVNGNATVDSSTVSGNQAPAPTRRGGIAALGFLSMNNATVSGNRAAGQFGVGLYAPGSSYDVHSSTFADNSTSAGGFEIEASGSSVFIENSALGGDAARNCSSGLSTNGGNVETGNTCGFGAGDLINTNPLLGLLADNGGFTQTHGLLSGSPAIDAGNGSCPPPAADQRGVTRPIGVRCDSGAFEGTVVITPTFFGPTPYLSKADSPFLANINAGLTYLETMECGLITVPGVTPSAGSVFPPTGITDSVDADDGSIDGFGTGGRSFFSGSGSVGIDFTFSAAVLGALPTEAGIVWTDGAGTTTFEAFDAGGASLGMVGPVSIADFAISGETGEDNFFGVRFAGGISKIHISNSSGGIEVDHLQYGLYAVSIAADLSIAKSDSPDPVATGAALTYTLDVSNAGPSATCAAVTVTDTLPASVTFVSASGPGWNCSETNGIVTCVMGSLAVGASPPITIQVTAPASSGSITNSAVVASQTPDPVAANNTASATTSVGGPPSADMQVTKTGPAVVTAGSNVVYSILIKNNGPDNAAAVTVSDATPAGLSFVSNSGDCASAFPCSLGTVTNGQMLLITSTFAVPVSYPNPSTSNTASVASTTADPTSGNNSSTATTTVNGSGPPSLSIGSVAVIKPASGTIAAVFPVTMSQPSASDVVVSYASSDGTALSPADYQAVAASLLIPAGSTSASITVLVKGNTIASDDKSFTMALFNPANAVIAPGAGFGTGLIQDRTPLPSLSIGDVNVSPGGSGTTPAVFAVTLSSVTGRTVSVNYSTADGTATAGNNDYIPSSGTLVFAPGETSKTVNVSVVGKSFAAPSNFFVDLSPAVNATVARARGTASINRAFPSLSIGDAAVQAPGSAVFPVSLSLASTQTVTVSFATADRTAFAGIDYTALSGALTFAPGETAKSVAVAVLPGGTVFPTKVFRLILSNPSGALLAKSLGEAAIFDQSRPLPPGPYVYIDDVFVVRPGSSFALWASVPVRLTAPSAVTINLSYTTRDGSARGGTDYLPTSGILTIAPGETMKRILVPVLRAPAGTPGRNFGVLLSGSAVIPVPEATVSIIPPGP